MKRIMREREVREVVGVCRTTLWRWARIGNFPKPVRLGENCVGWLTSDVEGWIEEKKKEAVAKEEKTLSPRQSSRVLLKLKQVGKGKHRVFKSCDGFTEKFLKTFFEDTRVPGQLTQSEFNKLDGEKYGDLFHILTY